MEWEKANVSNWYECWQCLDGNGNIAEIQNHRKQYVLEVEVEYSTMLKYTINKEYAPKDISSFINSMLEPFRVKGVEFPKFVLNGTDN